VEQIETRQGAISQLELSDVVDHPVRTWSDDVGHTSRQLRRNEHAMLQRHRLLDDSEHASADDDVTRFDRRGELPEPIAIQCGSMLSSAEEIALNLRQALQRTLDAVEHGSEEARAQLNCGRLPGAEHRRADHETAGLFVDLQRR
jgi:hypothetical protein